MKKIYSLFLPVLFSVTIIAEAHSQSIIEINGTAPLSLNAQTVIYGGGAGVGFYSPPINIIPAPRKNIPSPLCLRFGGYFYLNGVGQKTFKSIPMLNPSQGNATVYFSNSLIGSNIAFKLSSSVMNGRIIPYAEGYAGYMYFSSDMSISPDNKDEESNSITLSKTDGLNIGASGGLQFRLTDAFYIDTGVMWSHSEIGGEYVDIRSLKQIGNSIGYKAEKLPKDFLVFKLGITGYITDYDGKGSNNGSFWDSLFNNIGRSSGGRGIGNIGLIKF